MTGHATQPSAAVLRLSADDNVVVLVRSVAAGERIDVEGQEVVLAVSLGLGHKLAARAIKSGEKILKYGVAIGSATCDIPCGGHVHLDTMQSDYLPTYTHDEGRRFSASA
jgi:altronate dehydratase small subunit